MVFKPAGVDELGRLTPRAETRLDGRDVENRRRANHTGTQTAATISDFSEAAQDAVAAMLAQGTGVTLSYNDAGNTLTITSTGGGGGGVTDPEVVRDTIGAALVGVGLVSVTLNDAADTITITTTATANSTDAQLRDRTTHTGVTPVAGIGTGTAAAGRYVDGGTGAWTVLPAGGGSATTDASALTSGTLPAARIGDDSITNTKLTGVLPASRLGTGTPTATTYLNGAGAWTTPAGGGGGGDGVVFEGRQNVITAHGATGNGTTDDRAAIQTAIDSGAPLVFPAGTYRVTNSLKLDANTDLYLAPGSRVVKDFANAGGNGGALFTNRVMATKINDAKIHGPGKISAKDAAATGSIFGLHGDRILLQDFTVDMWNGGRVIVLAGDYCRAINIKCYGSVAATNNGGLRYVGGRQFIALGCHVESGDDSFQFVPSPPGGDAISGLGIYDSAYIGCTGRTTNAKFMVIALQQEIPDGVVLPAWTQGIYNSGFIGCNGYGGVAALVVQNAASAAPIENCYVHDCNVDMALGLNTGTDADINAWASTGGITGFSINGLKIRNPRNQSVTISRAAVDTVIQNSAFSRGSQSPTLSVAKLGGTNTKFLNNRVDGGNVVKAAVTVEAPLTGGGSNPSRVLIRGNHIYNLGAGGASYGIDVFVGDRINLRENFFEQASGVTDAKGFRLQAPVTNAIALDNDTAALTSATKYANLATGATIGSTPVGMVGTNPTRTTDTARTTTTLTDDDTLQVTLNPGKTTDIDFLLAYTGDQADDFKMDIAGPADTVVTGWTAGHGLFVTGSIGTSRSEFTVTTLGVVMPFGALGATVPNNVRGSLTVTSATGGVLKFRYAKNAATTAVDTVVLAGSNMRTVEL